MRRMSGLRAGGGGTSLPEGPAEEEKQIEVFYSVHPLSGS